jgi:hypothetical protein
MAPAEFSLQCANFAKRSYQSSTNAWDSGGHTSLLSYFNFAVRLPSSGVRTHPRVSRFTGSPERLVPDSTYFCAPVGIDPMLEHDGHESIRRPGLSSDIQRAIGQRLRQHYAIERSLPARLADLLKELVAETRRTLKQMNDAADRAIDRHVTGPMDQMTETRRLLQEMNEAANRATDDPGRPLDADDAIEPLAEPINSKCPRRPAGAL